MKLYSDYPGRAVAQAVYDITAIILISFWIWVGKWVYDQVIKLTEFGVQMEIAGAGFRLTMADVGDTLGDVPFIGSGIRVPFDAASDAGGDLERAGQAQQQAFTDLAFAMGVGIAILPIATILVFWLVPRLRFAMRASSAHRLMKTGAGRDLFALRALMHQRPGALARIDDDPAGAWRRQDPEVLAALASLELKSAGVRLPPPHKQVKGRELDLP